MKISRPLCRLLSGVTALSLSFAGAAVSHAQAQTKKPNILILWDDDIGW